MVVTEVVTEVEVAVPVTVAVAVTVLVTGKIVELAAVAEFRAWVYKRCVVGLFWEQADPSTPSIIATAGRTTSVSNRIRPIFFILLLAPPTSYFGQFWTDLELVTVGNLLHPEMLVQRLNHPLSY
jgi:hypothetical protein